MTQEPYSRRMRHVGPHLKCPREPFLPTLAGGSLARPTNHCARRQHHRPSPIKLRSRRNERLAFIKAMRYISVMQEPCDDQPARSPGTHSACRAPDRDSCQYYQGFLPLCARSPRPPTRPGPSAGAGLPTPSLRLGRLDNLVVGVGVRLRLAHKLRLLEHVELVLLGIQVLEAEPEGDAAQQ